MSNTSCVLQSSGSISTGYKLTFLRDILTFSLHRRHWTWRILCHHLAPHTSSLPVYTYRQPVWKRWLGWPQFHMVKIRERSKVKRKGKSMSSWLNICSAVPNVYADPSCGVSNPIRTLCYHSSYPEKTPLADQRFVTHIIKGWPFVYCLVINWSILGEEPLSTA